MYSIDKDIKKGIESMNLDIKKKYEEILGLNDTEIREMIDSEVGSIKKINKANINTLNEYKSKGGIVGVDGSVNRKGSSHPHYIEIFRGLAKSTNHKEDISKVEVYSPMLDEEENILEEIEENEQGKRDILLATLEIEVALDSIDKLKPYAILMDGSLIRYSIYAKDLWLKLRYECEKRGILLVGVIEEIKTDIIGKALVRNNISKVSAYDKEILFGRLKYGEIIKIHDRMNKKWEKAELSSLFMRTSKTPTVIGMDILDIQRGYIEEMAELIFALTPEDSRGIPLWLDIVDKEVQISNEMIEAYLERYLDRDIYERFFLDMRSKRT